MDFGYGMMERSLHLARKRMKIPVDISADSHALRFGIFKQFAHNNTPMARD